jgi:hypothetical protein
MKIVSTDKILNINAMDHDLEITSIMLNRMSKDTMLRVSIKDTTTNVRLLIVSVLSSPLPYRSTASAAMCVRV